MFRTFSEERLPCAAFTSELGVIISSVVCGQGKVLQILYRSRSCFDDGVVRKNPEGLTYDAFSISHTHKSSGRLSLEVTEKENQTFTISVCVHVPAS